MAGKHRPSGTEGYAESADRLAQQYESVTFAEVHRDVLHLFPTEPSRIIDIGAGTGRDAAALAAMGHSVVAVEPTSELRTHAQRLHQGAGITWLDDALPDLRKVEARSETFDLVLLASVWMHLDTGERRRAIERIRNLLAPGALLLMSLRHGPIPDGRRMFDVTAAETCALAGEAGLELVHRSERDGLLNPGVRHTNLAFRKSSA